MAIHALLYSGWTSTHALCQTYLYVADFYWQADSVTFFHHLDDKGAKNKSKKSEMQTRPRVNKGISNCGKPQTFPDNHWAFKKWLFIYYLWSFMMSVVLPGTELSLYSILSLLWLSWLLCIVFWHMHWYNNSSKNITTCTCVWNLLNIRVNATMIHGARESIYHCMIFTILMIKFHSRNIV